MRTLVLICTVLAVPTLGPARSDPIPSGVEESIAILPPSPMFGYGGQTDAAAGFADQTYEYRLVRGGTFLVGMTGAVYLQACESAAW